MPGEGDPDRRSQAVSKLWLPVPSPPSAQGRHSPAPGPQEGFCPRPHAPLTLTGWVRPVRSPPPPLSSGPAVAAPRRPLDVGPLLERGLPRAGRAKATGVPALRPRPVLALVRGAPRRGGDPSPRGAALTAPRMSAPSAPGRRPAPPRPARRRQPSPPPRRARWEPGRAPPPEGACPPPRRPLGNGVPAGGAEAPRVARAAARPGPGSPAPGQPLPALPARGGPHKHRGWRGTGCLQDRSVPQGLLGVVPASERAGAVAEGWSLRRGAGPRGSENDTVGRTGGAVLAGCHPSELGDAQTDGQYWARAGSRHDCDGVSGLHSPLTSGGSPLLLQGVSLICQPHPPNARPQRPAGPSSLSPNFSLGWLLSFIRLPSPGSDMPSLVNTTNSLSMKIIDEYCIIKIEKSFI